MKVYFNNKELLTKELINKNNKDLVIKFRDGNRVELNHSLLKLIGEFAKNDKKFIKKLISTEKNLIIFTTKLLEIIKLNK
jgi:hypothetical protein